MPLALVYLLPAEALFDLGTVDGDLDARPLALIAVWPAALTLFYARRALALDRAKAAVVALLPVCLIAALVALISALPALAEILAQAIMAALFGKPVDEAAMEGAVVGYVLWQALFYLAVAALAALLVAYAILVHRHRRAVP